ERAPFLSYKETIMIAARSNKVTIEAPYSRRRPFWRQAGVGLSHSCLRGGGIVTTLDSPTVVATVTLPPWLLGNNVVADGKAAARAPHRLAWGEERLEQFVPDLRRNADAVVVNSDFYRVA